MGAIRTLQKLAPTPHYPLVRLGSQNDGGYLVPESLLGSSLCLSAGVSDNWSFESSLLAQYGINSRLCDKDLPGGEPPFPLDRIWLDSWSHGDHLSLSDWIDVAGVANRSDLVLQMDIEGAEWAVLGACELSTLKQFRVLVLELHDVHLVLDEKWRSRVIDPVLTKVTGVFSVEHLHINNSHPPRERGGFFVPPIVEVTLVRRDLVAGRPQCEPHLPHPLDAPCNPHRQEARVPWYWQSRQPNRAEDAI